MIPVTDIRARESFCFMRWSKSSWGFFRWVSCSLFFISYRPFHSPCSCISRSPGSAERACGASPWQRWPPCWCPALLLGQDAAWEIETVQWWNCCGNTWRCVAMCIVRDVYSGLPVEVVQWVSLTFYPFFICFLSHSGRYTLTSLNLVYEVLLFSTLIPCQHQEEWPQY